MKALYVVDYSNWVYKFKHVFSKLGVVDDLGRFVNTSVLHGFSTAIKGNRFSDIVIALDGYPERSYSLLPQYKQQREHATSDQIFVPKREVIQFLTKLGEIHNKRVRVVASRGQEADQVIASICNLALGVVPESEASFADLVYDSNVKSDSYLSDLVDEFSPVELDRDYDTVIIGSTDSDMYQLKALGNVFMDSSWNGTMVDFSDSTPKAVHNMPPSTIAIYKSFLGDTSDNVPAVVSTRTGTRVRSIIREKLNSDEKFTEFRNAVKLGTLTDPDLIWLSTSITSSGNQLSDLERNYRVTKLSFESTPVQLSYPSYDVDTTIYKYRLFNAVAKK